MGTGIEIEGFQNDGKLDFVFQLFTSMQKDNLNYIYRGVFSQRIMETILGMAESNIVTVQEKSVIKKRVYHIMVECLQNITRHQAPSADDYSEDASLFILQKKYRKYYITTGNIIEPELILGLKDKIEKINSLSPLELKDYYKQMLINGMISEKGGAGLGLIDIARKSGNKLTYHFKTINEDKAFFLLTTEVFAHEHNLHASPAENLEENTEELAHENIVQEGVFSIESISELHDLLNKNNIKIIFNNYFNTDSLETLLIFLDKQICETLNVDRKVYTVMVELFLNIIIHGSNPIESKRYKGNPGLFFISEVDGKFIINTSSYITNDKIDVLLEKVDYVNNMTTEETEAMEESIDVQKVVAEKGGLGLASIRQITKSNIEVHLCKVDDEYTFLTISCSLSKAPKVPFEEIVLQLDESQWADSEVADVITEEGLELLSDEMLVVDALNAEFHLGNDSDGHQPVPEAGKKEENPAEDLSANKHIEAAQKLSGAKETEEENNQSEL